MKVLIFLALMACCAPVWAESPRLARGSFRQSAYAAVMVDARRYQVDLLVYGRRGERWTDDYRTLGELPKDCLAVLNGTFFSLKWNEPAGILVYEDGRKMWTPKFKRLYGEWERQVASLPRWYLAVMRDGRARIGNSAGAGAGAVARRLGSVRVLLGGGGLLVRDSARGLSAASLRREGFDERSGIRPEARVPRTAVGVDGAGRMWWLTAESLALTDVADLCLQLGCKDAIFLDCGSSTAMKAGSWSFGQGRPLPTWLVCREAAAGHGTALGR